MPTATLETTTLRAPRPTDVEALGQVCFDAFGAINARHGFPSDMPSVEIATGLMGMVLSLPHVEGIVAEREGRPIGGAFLWPDGPVAGIGPVTVDPEAQNENVGKRMMEWIVERGDALGLEGQRLVQAAFHGRSMALYAKMGFDVVEPLVVMNGETLWDVPGRAVRAMTVEDMAEANALCKGVHGHSRAGELAGAVAQGQARAVFADGRMTGYATAIGFFGHAVGEENDDILALIGATEAISGAGILVPNRNSCLFRACLERGLRIVYPATLMARGTYQEPKGPFLPSILY